MGNSVFLRAAYDVWYGNAMECVGTARDISGSGNSVWKGTQQTKRHVDITRSGGSRDTYRKTVRAFRRVASDVVPRSAFDRIFTKPDKLVAE